MTDSGVFTTGEGQMTVNENCYVSVGNIGSGTLNANGNISLSGGQIKLGTAGVFNWAGSTTMTIQLGGQVTCPPSWSPGNANTVSIGGSESHLILAAPVSLYDRQRRFNGQCHQRRSNRDNRNGFGNALDRGV